MKEAYIDETANVFEAVPSYKDAIVVNGPPGTTTPRLRCYLFFKEKGQGPYGPEYTRAIGWYPPHLRELWYDSDKEHSSLAAGRAIPELVNDINVRRDPRAAEESFKFMVMYHITLSRHFERIRRLAEEDGGSGS